MITQGNTGDVLGMYQYVFVAAIFIMSLISVIVVLGLIKAKNDSEKQLKLQQTQVDLLVECRNILKGLADRGSFNTDSPEKPGKE